MLKFFVADPDPGSGAFFTLDLGSKTKKSDPGLNVLDLQHGKKDLSAKVRQIQQILRMSSWRNVGKMGSYARADYNLTICIS